MENTAAAEPAPIIVFTYKQGIPVREGGKLLKMRILECFQADLSWECVLNKRDVFRGFFDRFDLDTICNYFRKNRPPGKIILKSKVLYETERTSPSDAISKELKKRDAKFVGITILYAYLQAVGVIYVHEEGYFLEHKSETKGDHYE